MGYEIPDAKTVQPLMVQILRIGNNLNQLTRRVHQVAIGVGVGPSSEEVLEMLGQVREVVEEAVREILSRQLPRRRRRVSKG